MQITHINGYVARCEARGVERDASLLMMLDQGLQVGDYVMISVGNVVARIDEEEARKAWELYDEMFTAIDSSTA